MEPYIPLAPPRLPLPTIQPTLTMVSTTLMLVALVGSARGTTVLQSPTECADGSMTQWMHNNGGKNPCELVQDVLRVCKPSFNLGFLPRGYTCDNAPGSALAPCCCGSPTFALMSACWSCQYNITFDLVSTTFTGFVKDCQTLPNPIMSYETSVQSRIKALDLPLWSQIEPLAGKWDFTGAWRNSTPSPTSAPPEPTGYPIQVNSTGISKGALAGSRVHVDLDEETTSPRSSRWLGIPSYLQPTSFHSHSSATSDHPIPGQQELDPHHTSPGAYVNAEEGGVTPFISSQRPVESEKTRARRQSTLLRVANTGVTSDEDNNAPAPQPELLAHATSVSSGPVSPPAALAPSRILSTASRSNSHTGSLSTSNLHGHPTSVGSGSGSGTRYQEDDAGVSIVIEDGSESPEPVRSVPPAYVDYRKGYSDANLDKGDLHRHGSAQADGSNNTHGESSRSGGSEAGRRGETSDSSTCIETPSDPPSPKKTELESHDTDTVDAKTMTETNTVREPDYRDRHESGDSEGAATIKPPQTENPGPIERSSTTDLAALTAANTAANRPNSSGSNEPSQPARPPHQVHTSAPAGVTFSEPMSQDHANSEHDVRQTLDDASPSSTENLPSANSAPWSWSRALGVFGLAGTNAPNS
ncbi:unnamed protein product [Rhizoctonia solani]|uniref:Uncharacterized protein n=1 Tax=Rhizoctonia solani TaxID=456999 RepID=A0A8H3GZ01_9AGAM|nr:unnamed protein product [Rhizoctonia solani]